MTDHNNTDHQSAFLIHRYSPGGVHLMSHTQRRLLQPRSVAGAFFPGFRIQGCEQTLGAQHLIFVSITNLHKTQYNTCIYANRIIWLLSAADEYSKLIHVFLNEQLLFTANGRKQYNDNIRSKKTIRHIYNLTKQNITPDSQLVSQYQNRH